MKTLFYLLVLVAILFGGFKYYQHLENSKEVIDSVTITRKEVIGRNSKGKKVYKEFTKSAKYTYLKGSTDEEKEHAKSIAENNAIVYIKDEANRLISENERKRAELRSKKERERLSKLSAEEREKEKRAYRIKLAKMAVSYYKDVREALADNALISTSSVSESHELSKDIYTLRNKLGKAVSKKRRLHPNDEKSCENLLKEIMDTLSEKAYDKVRYKYSKSSYSYRTINTSAKKRYDKFKEWYSSRFEGYPNLSYEFGKPKSN